MREEGDLVVEGFVAERCIGEMWARVPREPREQTGQRIQSCHVGLMILPRMEVGAYRERFRRGGGKKECLEAMCRPTRECHLCRICES